MRRVRKNGTGEKVEKGSRNLIILGIASMLIALSTTGVSLAIYHNSGDIYLDRSRPGYLPDEEEIEDKNETQEDDEYDFQRDGVITKEGLGEYLENLEKEIKTIDEYKKPFGAEVLSDEHLGIPTGDNVESPKEGE